jgi:CO/xanthine dehydrogenase Mo-binding subunit
MSLAGRCSRLLDGHPITYKLSRQDHNHLGTRQYDTRHDLKIGAKKDGTIVAWTGVCYGNGGGAGGNYGLQKTFIIPNISLTTMNITTNAPNRGAWRCVSDPPGTYNYNQAIDKLAFVLGLDPYAVRMKNFMPADMPDQDTGLTNGRPRYWSAKAINVVMPKCYQDSGYASKWHAPGTRTLADGRMHGIAFHFHQDSHGGVSGATRYGHLRMGGQDNAGQCILYMGGGRGSSGQQTNMPSIAAEVLGLKFSDMSLGEYANSDINLDTGSQGGSAYTGGAGSGFYNAALVMRNKLFERACTLAPFNAITPAGVTKATATATVTGGRVSAITVTNGGSGYTGTPSVTFTNTTGNSGAGATATAAVVNGVVTGIAVISGGYGFTGTPTVNISGVTPNDLDAKNSSIFLKSDPTKTITHAAVTNGMDPFIATSGGWAANFRAVPEDGLPGSGALKAQLGDAALVTGAPATCVEVAVDTETGEVEVTGIWNYIGPGQAGFYQGCMKECGSGAEHILNQTLFFGDVYDAPTAAVLQVAHGSFSQMTSLDYNPASFHLALVQKDDVAAPCGCHGIGEPVLVNVACIPSAIFNATGKWVDPEHGALTPDKVLKALGKA